MKSKTEAETIEATEVTETATDVGVAIDPTTVNVIDTNTDAAAAIHAALAIPSTTPHDALSYLHTIDPEAAELWRIRGPKGTKIVEISAFVLEVDDTVKRVLSSTFSDGRFKLYVEAKAGDLA